ncbi:dihydrodipicolinate synthase family protein [Paraburkholderia sp. HD33-4]|uniref:dihydrodipicolinate synthase family protein n=1 Tax=Paraburkholderia sp. HD33-4 TaxID=2883242 RepID=UPI001F1BE0BA|nr:dihydrodipicolinate synthase family protein [Paraburkholderia sp. HD33-4]
MSKASRFVPEGVIPACLLPFDQDLNIDERSYRSHLNDLVSVDGITGITINGHAAEVHALTYEEQHRVAALTKEILGDRVPIITGIFTNSSLEAGRMSRMAQEEGADALLVFPPDVMVMGGHLRPEMITEHLRRITDASDLPIILFQFPLASNLSYPLDTLLKLLDRYPQIRAIKDQIGDGNQHERHIRELHALANPVKVLTTHSAWLLGSLALGCDGLLSGAGSVIANLQVALFRAIKAGDLKKAQAINDRIYPTVRAFYDAPLLDMHNRMKEALVYLGKLPEAYVRPPLIKPGQSELEKIRLCMDKAGLDRETAYAPVV